MYTVAHVLLISQAESHLIVTSVSIYNTVRGLLVYGKKKTLSAFNFLSPNQQEDQVLLHMTYKVNVHLKFIKV